MFGAVKMATQQRIANRPPQGRILIASPSADDSPYRRSVVLLLEHNARGAAGVVLDGSFAESLEKLRDHLPRIAQSQAASAASLAVVPVKVAMWQPGQLDKELKNGTWFNAVVGSQQLLHKPIPPWHELVREIGRSVYRDSLGIKHFPNDPTLN
jgi:putative AlgH/UPF0301 family transcriptional regulator